MQLAKISPISKNVESSVDVPGSKSYSLRVLLISAHCKKTFKISNLLYSDDTKAMQSCLNALKNKNSDLSVKDSGVTARFMTALACITPGVQIIGGSKSLQKRPIKDLVNELSELGAQIDYMEKDGYLPIKVSGSSLTHSEVKISGQVSSQYISALLLIAPLLPNGLIINVDDDQISKPYIDMTLEIMNHFGVDVNNQNCRKYIVKPQKYKPKKYVVEGDYSSAGYFFAIAALNNSKITVNNLNPESKQADIKLLDILKEMGASIEFSDSSVTVNGNNLKPINVDMKDCPDQAMTAAVLCAFVKGKSTISGIGSLRIKETERIKALENELAKMGINTSSTKDSLTIFGGEPKPARIDTYGDHRIAMSFAVAATHMNGIEIINPDVVNKTFPGFWKELSKVTKVKIENKNYSNIVLIGMRGTGKSTIGKIIADKLQMSFLDTDRLIEAKTNKKIKEIVQENGWDYFRKIESEVCRNLPKANSAVNACGGGTILDKRNYEQLKDSSIFILLNASPEKIYERIKADKNRPSLAGRSDMLEDIKQTWQERSDKYFAAADFVIESEDASPDEVAEQIIDKIGRTL